MDRLVARRLLVGAIILGLLAEVVLDGPAFGINILTLVLATLAIGWLFRRRDRAPDPLDSWLPLTAVVLAAFVAVRADPFLALLDTFGAALFLGASIAAFSGLAITRRSAAAITTMAAWTLAAVVAGAPRVAKASRGEGRGPEPATGDTTRRRISERWAPIARGLVLGLPLAMIFAVLFASADPIFRRGLDDLLGWQIDLSTVLGRVLFIAAIAWLSAGLLSVATGGIPAVERSSLGAAARTTPNVLTGIVGATEAIIVLVVVDLVVGLFVGLQVAYLFGGQSTLVAVGMTYSDYARRGFFELVAAACLAGAVVVALETTVARRNRPYLALLLGLIGLTAIVLVSAALRLRLYQDAYGWTELRLYVLTTIAALGAALVVMVALALLGRMQWLGHGLAVIGVVALISLNLVAPAGFVAARNVERILDPGLVPPDGHAALDAAYLGVLPDDAVPVLVAALPRLPEEEGRVIRAQLEERRAQLRSDPAYTSPAAWNLGRERAREALATLP
ncbi:MAG TPA: DUF4173 domain-containing protein [Candidatus Limnocylindrales bacterium]